MCARRCSPGKVTMTKARSISAPRLSRCEQVGEAAPPASSSAITSATAAPPMSTWCSRRIPASWSRWSTPLRPGQAPDPVLPYAGAEAAHRRRLFRAARQLRLPRETELYLGLIHHDTPRATRRGWRPRAAITASTASAPNAAWRAAIRRGCRRCSPPMSVRWRRRSRRERTIAIVCGRPVLRAAM